MIIQCKIQKMKVWKIQEKEQELPTKYVISMTWLQTLGNGQRRPVLTPTVHALLEEAASSTATFTRAFAAASILPTTATIFPLGPHFM